MPDVKSIASVLSSPISSDPSLDHTYRMAVGADDREIPKWLPLLLRFNFFEPCPVHKDQKKNELNTYCIECDRTMCQNCQSSPASTSHGCAHPHHKLLQIRRYVYQSVVRVHDIQKFLDCSKIQPFTVNSAKVVLLNSKNNGKGTAGKEGQMCEICQRNISDSNRFCSIACKFRVFKEQQQASTAAESCRIGGHEVAPPATTVSSSSPFVEEDNPLVLLGSREDQNPIKPPASPRKRVDKRKGNPRRSPFF